MLGDLRFALHLVVKERWYSVVAVVALALGIGVNATVFTLVNAVLIKGLPFKDSQDLYVITLQRPSGRGSDVSIADLDEWRGQTKTFVGLGAFSVDSQNLSDETQQPAAAARRARHRQHVFAARAAADPRAGLRPGRGSERGGERRDSRLHPVEDPVQRRSRGSRTIDPPRRPPDDDRRRDAGRDDVPDRTPSSGRRSAPTAKEESRSTRFLQAFGRLKFGRESRTRRRPSSTASRRGSRPRIPKPTKS